MSIHDAAGVLRTLSGTQHSKSPDDEEARMERKKQSNRNHDHGINVIKKESDMERR